MTHHTRQKKITDFKAILDFFTLFSKGFGRFFSTFPLYFHSIAISSSHSLISTNLICYFPSPSPPTRLVPVPSSLLLYILIVAPTGTHQDNGHHADRSLLLKGELVGRYRGFFPPHLPSPSPFWFSYSLVYFPLQSFLPNQHFPKVRKITDLTYQTYPINRSLPSMQFALGNKYQILRKQITNFKKTNNGL